MAIVYLSSGKVLTDPSQLFEELAQRPARSRRMVELEPLVRAVDSLAAEWEAAAVASRSKEVRVYVRLMLEDLRELLDLRSPIELSRAIVEDELQESN